MSAHAISLVVGDGSLVRIATRRKNTSPVACAKTVTPITLVRLVASPPLKSPAPHVAAESSPKATAAKSAPKFIVSYCPFKISFGRECATHAVLLHIEL